MDKNDLLKQISESGYNIGFGAKKHFATYDIATKAPGWIGFLSIAIGVFALFIDSLSSKYISATFITLGFSNLLINHYVDKKDDYERVGIELTKLFNELKKLYYSTKTSSTENLSKEEKSLTEIENKFYSISISKHIFLSDWYAHYKFFWQHQIEWITEQKNFSFWRDKIPLSFSIVMALLIISALGLGWKIFMGGTL